MNIRLYHAKILTMEQDRPIFDGEIWITDDKIHSVLTLDELGQAEVQKEKLSIEWNQELDCMSNLLMPGFKNAHTHSAMTFLRSYADDLPLKEWLTDKVFPMEEKLQGRDIYQLTKLAILEYLTSGITSICDMYIDLNQVLEACSDTGMRCVAVSGLNDFTSSLESMETEYLNWNHKNPLLTYQLGFHAIYTCSNDLLCEISKLAHKYETPVYMHLSETVQEVEECKQRTGMTPVKFLESLHMFDFGGGAFHCVHLTDEDVDILKRRQVKVITNPSSNLKLASGIAPIASLRKQNITIGIGTDGPASNNCLDMFREMFLVSGLSKYREQDAASLDAMSVLHMATSQGAKTIGLDQADVLMKGKLADIIMIDLHQPNMQPIHNIPKNIVYSGSKSNILMTMIGGQIRYYNGEFFVGEESEQIYRNCNQIIQRMIAE